MAGILFIISAPSGSGKSTLVNHLRERVGDLEFSVSYTTRSPRGAERQDCEYHFTDRAHFERMIAADELFEHAEVFGNYYGTAIQPLRDAAARGKDLLLDIDVQGAAQVRAKKPDAVSILVMPPTKEDLATRLRTRSRAEGEVTAETERVIERRLAQAAGEIVNYRQYGYILVNDILDLAVEQLAAIVTSERIRRRGRPATPEERRWIELADSCRQANAMASIRPVLHSFGLLDEEAVSAK
jgi:guanylate kinase